MLDYIYHRTLILHKIAFLVLKRKDSASFLATSGLSVLLHGIISLPGRMSCDNFIHLATFSGAS